MSWLRKIAEFRESAQSDNWEDVTSAIIVTADADCLPRTLTNPLLVCENGLSTLTQTALDAFCQKYHILDGVHPKLPALNQSSHDSPAGKIGVYIRFFEFANFRIPLSQFLVDVLGYFRINLSQLSVIVAAKMSFSKRSDSAPVCYTKPLDSLKHWNDNFFWVDAYVFPLSVLWHTKKTVTRDLSPTADKFSAEACDFLTTHQAPFQKFSESFLCLVGTSHYYGLDDNVYPTFFTDAGEEMDLFAFIHHADPTKVRIGDHHDNIKDVEPRLNEESGDAAVADQTEESGHVVQDEKVNIVVDEDARAATVDRPKGTRRKRKAVGSVSGSNIPPKKLRQDHDTSGDAGASTAGKSLGALQGLLDRSTLAVEIGHVGREGGGRTDSIYGPNLRAQHPAKRFVISSYSSYYSSTNAADDEVTSIVRSSAPPPPVITVADVVTAVADTSSAPALGASTEPVHASIFADSASPSAAGPDTAGPSYPHSTNISSDNFYVSQEMDSETLQQIYVPKWNVINNYALDYPKVCGSMIDQLAPPGFFSQLRGMDYDQLFAEFNVGAAHQTCLSAEVRLRSEHNYRERKKFERKCQRQTDLLKEKDAEIAIDELNSLKERNSVLEEEKGVLDRKVATLESAAIDKETELAIKASSFEPQRDGLIDQLSSLETACSILHDQVSGYELFKEQIEAIQDEQVKVLSDHVAELDSDLMGMAVHLDEECLKSPNYVSALGAAIGLAIDKGMQTGLVAVIDHGKAGRGLADVAAYDPSVEERCVSAVFTFRDLNFNFLSQLESQKDANIADIMDSLCLEGPSAETPGVKEGALSHRLSISEAMGPLVDPLSSENLIGEASTSGVPATAATTTALSTTFAHTSSVPPISVTDYGLLDTKARPKASHSLKIIFEQETLETSPEHPATS
ncbi:hypothetical protein Tco_1221642 [Tanacetum coccineum]